MNLPVKIKSIKWSGGACPYQIEGVTEDNLYFYLRYRIGRLRAGVAKTETEFWNQEWTMVYNIFDIQHGNSLDGLVTHEEFMPLLEGKVIFPSDFKLDSNFCVEPQQDDPREEEVK